ncbi:sn-glycerol-3-phosphate ABC transporter ATP-binding protein UgpC [Winogradskya consettensis]|uniref:ABC transporter ATP-binding protein n=1 Tax=Winogradskya consettensis TaxID=113560 RepID=A0A919VTU4_9ACTN|nr:ABC transporter ATP-binding protein [Actinoplanes consettensis]GIM69282.1 ABC transporter ATP-binding protein [Actinoplanes consettensis]
MVAISARALTKIYDDDGGGATVAVDGITLDVAPGEFVVVVGPTGCGKSTFLRLIAGLVVPTSGEVTVYKDVSLVSPSLYPHLSVAQNIGFPLRAHSWPAGEVAARVLEIAARVGVADLLNRFPEHLSGGQRQRVSIARALVRKPQVLLLDEPLSNVDAGTRAALRGEIVTVTRELGVTTLYVTHDRTEAMTMADRVVVLRDGAVQQVGPPHEVYADPDDVFVATFLSAPSIGLLAGAVQVTDAGVVVDLGAQALTLPSASLPASFDNARVTVAIRPLMLIDSGRPMSLTGKIHSIENLGHELLVRVEVGGVPSLFGPAAAFLSVRATAPLAVGDPLAVGVGADDLLLFDGAGRRIRFGVPLDRIS